MRANFSIFSETISPDFYLFDNIVGWRLCIADRFGVPPGNARHTEDKDTLSWKIKRVSRGNPVLQHEVGKRPICIGGLEVSALFSRGLLSRFTRRKTQHSQREDGGTLDHSLPQIEKPFLSSTLADKRATATSRAKGISE